MKKVLYGVALTLLASASVGSLQSCKDDVNDLKTQTSYDLKNLQFDIEKKLDELEQGLLNEINSKQPKGDYLTKNDLETILSGKGYLTSADIAGLLDSSAIKKWALLTYVNKLIYGIEGLEQEYSGDRTIEEGGILGMVSGALNMLREWPEDYNYLKEALGDKFEDSNNIYNILGLIGAQQASIQQIEAFLNGFLYDENGNPLSGTEGYKNLQAYLNEINDEIKTLKGDLYVLSNTDLNAVNPNNPTDAPKLGRVTLLEHDMIKVNQKIANIENAMTDAFNYLDALNGRLDNLITSIKVERAVSPVFGDFAAPIGIKSNILFNWYGLSDNGETVPFPNGMDGMVGDGINLPTGDNIVLGDNGYFSNDIELGDVYVTVNPIGHKFDGTKLTLTTSAGNSPELFVTLKEENEYELMYGINNTRAAEEVKGNGFYKGHVTVPSSEVGSIKLSLDERLQTAVKDAVKDQTKRNAAALIKAIYNSMSDIMPAYALRYDWTSQYYNKDNDGKTPTEDKNETVKDLYGNDVTVEYPTWSPTHSDKSYAVLSGYDLGVAAARPLGFNFLRGEGASSDKVPTIGHLDNFIQEMIDKSLKNIKIQGKDMKVLGYEIGFANGEVNIAKKTETTLEATVTGVTVDGKKIAPVTAEFDDPAEASTYINKALSVALAKEIGKAGDRETEAKFEASVDIALLQMQKQINEVLADVNGQIHGDAFNNVGQSYIDKANRAIDLYNKVANKINNFLKDPNHYLQAAAFYAAGNNMGILSSNPKSPTVFTGSGNTITLYLSTYTGEIIAPAYKKYVAVTDGPGASNLNTGDLSKVLDGSRIAVDVNVAGFESGKTYELTYQAVDYRGHYSTRKCYIQVKK